MTTENVAVLFTDMVGSTALASGLSPDAADELRRGHFSVLRQAIAETGGSEVKNLGDGLMVVFTFGVVGAGVRGRDAAGRRPRQPRPRTRRSGLRVGLERRRGHATRTTTISAIR